MVFMKCNRLGCGRLDAAGAVALLFPKCGSIYSVINQAEKIIFNNGSLEHFRITLKLLQCWASRV